MSAKAVILAAGKGTRLRPLTPFLPKEMLPIGGFPCIHYILKELVSGGFAEVIAVLSAGKEVIRDYLTAPLTCKGAESARFLAERDEILSSIKIRFVYQETLLGTGHAIYQAAPFMEDEPMLVVYPDDLLYDLERGVVDPLPARKMMELCRKTGDSLLLATEIPGEDASRYGVLDIRSRGERLEVTNIVEKPEEYDKSVAYAMIGRMVITPRLMASIPKYRLTDGEGIIPSLKSEAKIGRLSATLYQGRRFDVGSHHGYQECVRAIVGE